MRYVATVLIALTCVRTYAQESLAVSAAHAQAAMAIAPLSCSTSLLTCASSVTASPSCLSDQYYLDLYTISATVGQTITLTATTSTGYQMLVTVQASNGTILTSRFGPSPLTLTYAFASSGTHFIGFGYVAQFATGSYNLKVSCGSTNTTCRSSGTIGLNTSISGQLTASDGTACLGGNTYSAVYGFAATKDIPVVITFASSFAPYIEVEPASGDTGVWRSSSVPGSVTVTFLPPATGNNWIYFTTNTTSPTTGSYTLRLEPLSTDPCRRRAVSH
jgi:hypothetical protein